MGARSNRWLRNWKSASLANEAVFRRASASTLVEVTALVDPRMKVEIEAVACVGTQGLSLFRRSRQAAVGSLRTSVHQPASPTMPVTATPRPIFNCVVCGR